MLMIHIQQNQSGSTSPSLSARRRRIKVLPKSETDDLKPDQVCEVSAGDDPNVKKETSGSKYSNFSHNDF